MNDGLSCARCGSTSTLFPLDDEGMAWEGWEQVCPECFHRNEVTVDGEHASVSADEDCLNVGQPRCNGSCGACAKWVNENHPCDEDCGRLSDEDRNNLIIKAKEFNSENPITACNE